MRRASLEIEFLQSKPKHPFHLPKRKLLCLIICSRPSWSYIPTIHKSTCSTDNIGYSYSKRKSSRSNIQHGHRYLSILWLLNSFSFHQKNSPLKGSLVSVRADKIADIWHLTSQYQSPLWKSKIPAPWITLKRASWVLRSKKLCELWLSSHELWISSYS